MAKLNQIIAVEKGIKSKSFHEITEAHHAVQKPALLSGISRTYQANGSTRREQLRGRSRPSVRGARAGQSLPDRPGR